MTLAKRMAYPPRFALNHILAPKLAFAEFFDLAAGLGVAGIELRNDLDDNVIKDGTPPEMVRDAAKARNLRILTINALRRFNDWNGTREKEARALIRYARDSAAEAIVLCPVNDPSFRPSSAERLRQIDRALRVLKPILVDAGINGLIEVLGFPQSSLSLKREALEAIDAVDGVETFHLIHDSFHHFLAGDLDLYPGQTALVHISGVTHDPAPKSDTPRILVDERDILGTTRQMANLLDGGYRGFFSFEPFSPQVQNERDKAGAITRSMDFITGRLQAADTE